MSCNLEHFKKQEAYIRQNTFGKPILDGLYSNIDIYFYAASTDGKYHFNKKTHRIEVPCDDSINGTYEKTMMAFNMLDALKIEYDYLLRTNCSTMINLNNLNNYINAIEDENKIYVGQIYSTPDGSGPEPFDFYGIGKGIILSHKWVDIIRNYDIEDCRKYITDEYLLKPESSIWNVDDNAIGLIINSYCIDKNIDRDNIYECYHMKTGWSDAFYLEKNHKMLRMQLAIPYRTYDSNREVEFERADYLWNRLKINDYGVDNIYQLTQKINPVVHVMFNNVIYLISMEDFNKMKKSDKIKEEIKKLFKKTKV